MTLLTTPEVAERLGVSLRTVHRMVEDERLTPVLRVGKAGAFLFDPATLPERENAA